MNAAMLHAGLDEVRTVSRSRANAGKARSYARAGAGTEWAYSTSSSREMSRLRSCVRSRSGATNDSVSRARSGYYWISQERARSKGED